MNHLMVQLKLADTFNDTPLMGDTKFPGICFRGNFIGGVGVLKGLLRAGRTSAG